MAVASSTLSAPSNRGSRPAATSPAEGGSTNRLVRNPIAMIASSPLITRSNVRWPRRFWIASSSSDTNPVITPPTRSGRSNSRCSAIAPPTTSARSVAMATNSACSQYAMRVGVRVWSATASGRRPSGDEAELGRQELHQAGHRVGHDDHPDEEEAVLRACADVGRDVAGIDVGDGGDERQAQAEASWAAAVARRPESTNPPLSGMRIEKLG